MGLLEISVTAGEHGPVLLLSGEADLTTAGEHAMAGLAQAAADHDEEISAPLTPAERAELNTLLAKLAAARGLVPGVHPGYRHLAAGD